ncbi:MAG: radical SAM family heme chaperone HemW [Syntrophobacteraceae bacterium]
MNRTDQPGIYVHVPFCRKKCPYCDFYSIASLSLLPSWVDAVQKEASLYAERFSAFDSIYFGGGTPTLLDDRQLATLIDCLSHYFSFSNDVEVTIEANPDDITRAKLRTYRELGFNRISVGVQSFDDAELQFLGRRHTAKQTMEALSLIRECGFDNLGLDLIYGFNAGVGLSDYGARERSWAGTLQRALAFMPEHISCYQMTYAERTPFAKMAAEGKIRPLNEEAESSLFLFTSNLLQDAGYIHYEISNFAKDPDHASRHNQKYWSRAPYLGLGPAAHSYQERCRWWNVRSVREYCSLLSDGKLPIHDREYLSDEQLRLESLSLGFRTADGVDLDIVLEAPGSEAALRELQQSELVRVNAGKVIPTLKGFLVADSLPLMFCR